VACEAVHASAGIGSRRGAADKACIPQDDIDRSLACLPVFLAGCERLAILIGESYVTRLWVRAPRRDQEPFDRSRMPSDWLVGVSVRA
jgi:hypothetical protein